MDGLNLFEQPRMTDLAIRWDTGLPGVVSRFRYPEEPARLLHWQSFRGHHCDGRVHPFGLGVSFKSCRARTRICTSSSSSRMRRFALASSAFSALVVPGSSP